jgi:hypothetical protein
LNTPKVLVGCPINKVKHYSLSSIVEVVSNLTYGNYEVFFSDNSDDFSYHRQVYRQTGIETMHVKNEIPDNPMCGIAQSQNQIRTKFLYGNFSHLMFIEEDVIPPLEIIELLISHRRAVASAPYYIGLGSESQIAMMGLEEFPESPVNRLIPFEESFLKIKGEIIPTKGCGVGCCLISRTVMEQVSFGIDRRKRFIPSDTYLYYDLHMMGIPLYLDTSIICKHNNQQWKITM